MDITNNEMFRAAMDNHAIVSISDVKGNILHANDLFCDITGFDRDELLGQNHRIVKSDAQTPEFFKSMWRDIAQGKTWRGEIKNRKKNGAFYWVKTTITPIMDSDGKPWRYVGIRTDITEQKLVEEKLIAVKAKLKHALDMKTDFMSRMNHEIRTPLNGIIGLTEVLGEITVDAEQVELIEALKDSSARLMHLMGNLLDTELSTNVTELDFQKMSQSQIRSRLVAQWLPVAQDRGVDFNVSFADNLPDALVFDFEVVTRLINELLKNAFTNTLVGAVGVHIRTGANETVVTEVSDTGPGIKEDMQERVFEPFVQQDTSNTRSTDGAGLGLSVCRELAEGFGGQVTLCSSLGKGSVFSVHLPIIAP